MLLQLQDANILDSEDRERLKQVFRVKRRTKDNHMKLSLGYRCIVPRDAVNSNRPQLADASLEDIDRYLGWVVTADEAEAMLS